MVSASPHPSAVLLAEFVCGTIRDAARDAVEGHVAGCPQCQRAATAVTPDGVVALLRRAHAGHGRTAAETASYLETPAADGPTGADALPAELLRHDRYRIGRLLGQGGMGSVYEAEHRVMGRAVAIKVIRRAFTDRPAAVERFRREVRAAAALSHPNVVSTLDAEDAGGTHFLVMERVDGDSLARVIRARGPLPPAEACEYARQAALGLHHAHVSGLVHRDVKPDNLMLVNGPDGVVKVLDFGIAALVSDRAGALTAEGVIMGTPDYIAPEQAIDPRAADARADVYGLGCTLFFLLTGRPPFPAETAVAKVIAHREHPVPLAGSVCPTVPAGLDRVLARLMAKRPEDRYRSCAEVAVALEPFTKPTPPPKPRRRLAAVLVALAAVLLAGGVVYRVQTDKGELVITTESDDVEVVIKQGGKVVRIVDTKTNKSITLNSGVYELELAGGQGLKLSLDKATLTRGDTVIARIERVPAPAAPVADPKAPVADPVRRFHHGTTRHVHDVAFSPDGRQLAAIDVGDGARGTVTLWDVATGKLVRKYPDIGWGVVKFTPDGKQLVVLLSHSVRVFDVATGNVVRDLPATKEFVWAYNLSPDGRHLTTLDSDKVFRLWNLDTGRELRRWDGETDPQFFTPDGKQIVLSVRRDPDLPFRLWNIADGKETPGNGMPFRGRMYGSFLKGGKEIAAVRDGALHIHDWATGKPLRRIALGAGFEGERGCEGTISPDGRLFFCTSLRGEPRLWDLATGNVLDLPPTGTDPLRMFNYSISPDNRWVALGHKSEIVVIRLPDLPPVDPVRLFPHKAVGG